MQSAENNNPITQKLAGLFEQAVAITGSDALVARHDPEWPSVCEIRHHDDEVFWRPIPQNPPVDFRGLANAVDQPIHPDIASYYGSFWAGSLETESEEGHVSLIQLWNEEDFERLIGNLVGHYMMKRRDRLAFTVFFANTEHDSELFLTIDNESGAVLLEEPGRVVREVEPSLIAFLARLTPVRGDTSLY